MGSPTRYAVSLDGYCESKLPMQDAAKLTGLIYKVAALADMTILNVLVSEIDTDLQKLGSPVFEDEGGISVLALISTSHIALHCWPERKFFMFDLVSCRAFCKDSVLKLLLNELRVLNDPVAND